MLDIRGTQVRDISGVLNFSKLKVLDISGIDEVSIPSQLIWSRNLQMLTVSRAFAADPTITALQRRGVIVTFTEE